jgi:hypothetical protein
MYTEQGFDAVIGAVFFDGARVDRRRTASLIAADSRIRNLPHQVTRPVWSTTAPSTTAGLPLAIAQHGLHEFIGHARCDSCSERRSTNRPRRPLSAVAAVQQDHAFFSSLLF